MEVVNYKKGDVIFRENTWDLNIYIVEEGSVGVYLKHGTEREYLLNELQPGYWFGEKAVLEMRKRSTTAIALSDCQLYRIEGNEFEDLIRLRPEAVLDIYVDLCQNLRRLSARQEEARSVINDYLKNEGAQVTSSSGLRSKIMGMISDYYKGSRRLRG